MFLRVFLALVFCTAPFGAQAQPLAQAVESALNTHPDTRGAYAAVKVTSEELRQAQAGRLPVIDLRVAAGPETTESTALNNAGVGKRTETREDASLTLRQMLFDASGVGAEVDRQNARLDAARLRLADTGESIAQRAMEAYLTHLRDLELLALSRANVVVHDDTLKRVELRFRSGAGSQADVQQALARVALARSTLQQREGAARDSAERYQRVVGQDPGALVAPPAPARLPATLEAAKEAALASHPKVVAAQAELDAARAQTRAADSPMWPRLDAEVAALRNRNAEGIRAFNNNVQALLVLRYNLYRGGADSARIREFAERENVAHAQLEVARRTVLDQVATAWIGIETARGSLQHIEQHVAAGTRVRSLYYDQFELGRRSLLDLLNIENELFGAQSSLAGARTELRTSEYRLLSALGTLVQALGLQGTGPLEGIRKP